MEYQALIGMSLAASLEEAGFAVAGPFMSSAHTLEWLEGDAPDLAVLDVMLKDGSCLQIAREPKRQGVPFAVYSGLPPRAKYPLELRNAPGWRSLSAARRLRER